MSGSIGAASNHQARRSVNPCPDSGSGHWRLASKLEFGPLPSAVPCARLHATSILREWNLAHVADDAELIVSELMTNALTAAGQLPNIEPVVLHLQASDEYLVIQVWDALSAAPAPRPHAIDSEAGRGLEIVSLLSDRWGFCHPADGGKLVWAALVTGAGALRARPLPPGDDRTGW